MFLSLWEDADYNKQMSKSIKVFGLETERMLLALTAHSFDKSKDALIQMFFFYTSDSDTRGLSIYSWLIYQLMPQTLLKVVC